MNNQINCKFGFYFNLKIALLLQIKDNELDICFKQLCSNKVVIDRNTLHSTYNKSTLF